MTDNKSVSKKNESNVIPFDIASLEADAGLGLQNITQEDLALPFLKILTAESAETIGGEARGGDIYNSVTQEVFKGDVGVKVIPCLYQRRYIEWAPQGTQGAPLNIYTPKDKADKTMPTTEQRGDDRTDFIVGSENYIENTAHHFVVLIDDNGRMETGLITMKKTGLKKSKGWNSMMNSRIEMGKKGPFIAPSFRYRYHLTTEKAKNDKGQWNTWKILLDGPVLNFDEKGNLEDPKGLEIYNFCKAFAESIVEGSVIVKHESDEVAAEKGTGEAPF